MPFDEVIAAAGLEGIENAQFGELSGGQKQRLLFALAICGNPDLLVLDEPTVGLDVEARRALWKQIRAFVAARTLGPADHALPRRGGSTGRPRHRDRSRRVVAEGTPSEIKRRRGRPGRRFLGSTWRTMGKCFA